MVRWTVTVPIIVTILVDVWQVNTITYGGPEGAQVSRSAVASGVAVSRLLLLKLLLLLSHSFVLLAFEHLAEGLHGCWV